MTDRVERDEVLLLARRALLNGQKELANRLFGLAEDIFDIYDLSAEQMADKLGIGI